MTDFTPPVTDMDDTPLDDLVWLKVCWIYVALLVVVLIFLQTAFAPQGETLGPGGAVSDASGADWEGE